MEGIIVLVIIVGLVLYLPSKKGTKGFEAFKKILSKDQIDQIKSFELTERVRLWQKKGLITQEQAGLILNPPTRKRISFISSIFYLAVGCIIIGIIGLIAANYDKIPPYVRLTTMMIALTTTTIGCWYSYVKGKAIALESFILACFGLVGANIGLVSQTFHLSGHVSSAIFLWSILALPYLILSHKNWWACAWYPFAFLSCASSPYGKTILDFFKQVNFTPISMALVLISGGLFLNKIAPKHLMTQGYQLWSKILCVFLWMCFDFILTYGHFSITPIASLPMATSGLLVLILSAIYPLVYFKNNRHTIALILISMIFAGISLFVKIPVLGMAFTLFILSTVAIYCARINQLKAFNFVVFLFFGRVLYAYFHLFGSLAATGTGILMLGIFILIGLRLWLKHKENLVIYLKNIK